MAMADEPAQKDSLLARALRSVTASVAIRPRATLWVVLVLSCAAVGVTVTHLRFRTERASLVDTRGPVHEAWQEYQQHFGSVSDLVLMVEADDPATIREVMDDLADRLQREPEVFCNVLHRVEVGRMQAKALQYLTQDELLAARRQVRTYSPILQGDRWDLVELAAYARILDAQIRKKQRAGDDPTPVVMQARLLTASLNRFYRHLANDFQVDQTTFRAPWPNTVDVDQYVNAQGDDVVYLMNDAGTVGFVKVLAVEQENELDSSGACIDRLREHAEAVRARYADNDSVRISLTGVPVLEHDEMRQSQTDMLKACGLAFLVVGGLLLLGFRGIRHPMLALLMLVVGVSWTFGFATLAVGHLNILSVSFAVILIGLGIDFSIHYLSRYLQLRHEGEGLFEALVETSGSVGTGIITAAVTTALAFLCAMATDFVGIAELGLIAGVGVLLCALATFLVLPALIRLSDAGVEEGRLPRPIQADAFRALVARWPMIVLVSALLLSVGLISQAFDYSSGRPELKVGYDANLLNMQAGELESVVARERLSKASRDSLLYAVALADSWEETLALKARFEALPSVSRVEELASRLPAEPSAEERALITALRSDLKRLPSEVPDVFGSADPKTVGQALDALYVTVSRLSGPAAESTSRDLDEFLNNLMELPLRSQVGLLNAYQNFMASSLLRQFRTMARATDLEPVRYADLPEPLAARFVRTDEDGKQKWLLQIFPSDNIWEEKALTQFVEEVRSVDPTVTGTPLQHFEASLRIRESYKTAAMYALAIISLVLLLDFLKPGQKLLTLLPPIAIAAFVGYTLHQRTGSVNPHLLVLIYLGMVAFIGAVLDFRNLRDMLLALSPPLMGAAMMLGAMGLLQMNLNPANLIVLPLVLGIGVDDGVHVLHDYRRQMRNGLEDYRISASTINGILLTSLTSMVGFGSLLVASHQGLFSVGLTLLLGVGCCGFVALVLLPSVLTLVGSSFAEEATVVIPEFARKAKKAAPEPQQKRAA